MHHETVNLTQAAFAALDKAAQALKQSPETALAYIIHNSLKVYAYLDLQGYLMLIDKGLEVGRIQLPPRSNREASSQKSARNKNLPAREVKPFTTLLEVSVWQEIELQASVLGYTLTDLINCLVHLGSKLAIHLLEGAVFAFDKDGNPLGKIEFS